MQAESSLLSAAGTYTVLATGILCLTRKVVGDSFTLTLQVCHEYSQSLPQHEILSNASISKWRMNPAFSNTSNALTTHSSQRRANSPVQGAGVKPLCHQLMLSLQRTSVPMTVIKTEINASLTIGKGTWAAATHTVDRNPIRGHLYCWVSTVRMALGLQRLLSLQSTRGGSRLNGRTNKETLVWKVHLLLLFLLGRFSRANCTPSPPSALVTVHSLQVRGERSRL